MELKNVVLLITEHLGMGSSRSMLCFSVDNPPKYSVLRTYGHSKIFNTISVKNHAETGFYTVWYLVLCP